MDIDFDLDYWTKKYESDYQNDNNGYPEYVDENGIKKLEKSPYFEHMSKTILERGFLYRDEFISVGKWKSKRPIHHYEDSYNSEERVKDITRKVLEESDDEEKVRLLLSPNLKGVKIAVASALLTIIYPEKYCIIDYRAWRAMKWLKNKSATGQFVLGSYSEYADYLDSLSYQGIENYLIYLDTLKSLFAGKGRTARRIEMALWKFDQQKGIMFDSVEKLESRKKTFSSFPRNSLPSKKQNEPSAKELVVGINNSKVRDTAIKLTEEIMNISNYIEQKTSNTNIHFYYSKFRFCSIFPEKKGFCFEVRIPENEFKKDGLNVTIHPSRLEWIYIHVDESTTLISLILAAKQAYGRAIR